MKLSLLLPFLLLLSACKTVKPVTKNYASSNLIVQKVRDKVYLHVTYLQTQSFGKVACNGMIVCDRGEAVVFDTPADDATSVELLNWIADSLHCKVTAVVPTHFHEDCLGGLAEFHRRGIPSYALNQTIALARQNKLPVPQHGFDGQQEFKVGKRKVLAQFPGEGHTRDNIIGYFPDEKVLFGGCLIKEMNATKGNLADANVNAWPETVVRVKRDYSNALVVIPGHGELGDMALLDYTIGLFQVKK